MKKHTKQILAVLVAMSISNNLAATVEADLNNFVSNIGGTSSITPASNFESQGYKYYTGGRISVRHPVKNVKLGSFKAPSYRVTGCGAIDMFGGSMSFVSANELVNTLKSIAGDALPSFLFMLAMRTVSSQISTTLQDVFSWMEEINKLSTNTCEAASWAANSAASGKMLSREQNNCINKRMESSAESYSEARQSCGTEGNRAATLNTPEAKKNDYISGNLAWMVMNKIPSLATDTAMKELLMSITGTLVLSHVTTDAMGNDIDDESNEDAKPIRKLYPSLFFSPFEVSDEKTLMDVLLNGGQVFIYKCTDTTDCYQMTGENSLVLDNASDGDDTNDALLPRARKVMDSIYTKIRTRGTPDATDMEFINSLTFPAYRMITVAAMMRGTAGYELVEEAAQTAAADWLHSYVDKLFKSVELYAKDPEFNEEGEKYYNQLKDVTKRIRDIRDDMQNSLVRTAQISERIQMYEKLVISGMSASMKDSLSWSDNISLQ